MKGLALRADEGLDPLLVVLQVLGVTPQHLPRGCRGCGEDEWKTLACGIQATESLQSIDSGGEGRIALEVLWIGERRNNHRLFACFWQDCG